MIRAVLQIAALTAAGLLGAIGAASAQVTGDDLGLNDSFEQTGDATYNESGAFFSARIYFTSPGDYTTGTLTLPSMSTVGPLTSQGPTTLGFEDVAPTLTQLQMTYGTGTYTFDVSGGSQTETMVDQSYVGDTYSNVALVTNYMALQGVNGNSVTLDLNGMIPGMGPTQSNIYLYVYNKTTNDLVYASGELPSTTTQIPIGDLAAGQSYYYNLEYDNRIFNLTDGGIAQYQIYDNDTNGDFFTAGAVPEPSTWAMMLIGFAGLGYVGYRGSRMKRILAA
jgi:PEP-CTERM motif